MGGGRKEGEQDDRKKNGAGGETRRRGRRAEGQEGEGRRRGKRKKGEVGDGGRGGGVRKGGEPEHRKKKHDVGKRGGGRMEKWAMGQWMGGKDEEERIRGGQEGGT